jgi:hypothetical protein
MARITVVSAGHMAHCPRMLKAADAFQAAGHDVFVVSTLSTEWGRAADRRLHAPRRWRWKTVDYSRAHAPVRWFLAGVAHKMSERRAHGGDTPLPFTAAARVLSRVSQPLVDAILSEPADLIYGGSVGAIAPVVEASRRSGTPCAVDFEDYHCEEHVATTQGARANRAAAIVMAEACREAAFVTAGSTAIAQAVEERFGRPALPIHNVFPLPNAPSFDRQPGPLRVYWFSQTVGPDRGIEDLVRAASRASIRCELHLRGAAVPGYLDALRACAARAKDGVSIVVHALADPDVMVASGHGFDAGLSVEQGHVANRAINLPNKALTYPLAGLGLILTKTRGQQPLIDSVEGPVLAYAPGDIDALAEGLRRWSLDPALLRRAREASWEAGRRRWHWEHPLERDALLSAVSEAVS